MTAAKIIAIAAIFFALGIFLLVRADKRKRVIVIEPMWRCAEVTGLGDAGCDWKAKSARIRDMPEPRGM
jgi:hypothetical protein